MPKSMLVADDSVVIQKSIGITFAQEEFNITYVNNGEDAVAKARQLKPDLILADIQMPKMDGYTVCQHLRSDPNLSKTPILLLAGTHEPYDEARGKSCGANGYVIKPFESQAMIDRVKELMGGAPAAAASPAATQPKPAAPATPPRSAPATTPTPASTIAGQSPFVPPKPAAPATPPRPPAQSTTPTPASTIAAMSPSAVRGATPMLETNPPAPATPPAIELDTSFDFTMEEAPAETPVIEASAVTASSPPVENTEALPSGDFWDFSEPSGVESAPAPVVAAPPALEIEPISDDAPFELSPAADFVAPADPTVVSGTTPAAVEFDLSGGDIGTTGEAAPEMDWGTPPPIEPADDSMKTEAFTAPAVENWESPGEMTEFATAHEPKTEPLSPPTGNGAALHLSNEQMEEIVSKVFKQVIERIAWEVVPDLAETIIKEELARLTQDKS